MKMGLTSAQRYNKRMNEIFERAEVLKKKYWIEHKGKNADGTDNYYYTRATPSQIKKYEKLKKVI